MTRMYADVSHFRAPFKNWPSLSATDPAAPTSPLDPATVLDKVDGVASFKPQVADTIFQFLATQRVIVLDADSVTVVPADAVDAAQPLLRESADAWVKRKIGEGKTVVAGSTGGAVLFPTPTPGIQKYLQAVKGHEAEVAATAGDSPLGAVLARPTGLASIFGKIGPIGVAALAVIGVGGAVLLFKKKPRRHATANRRRRHRR